MDFCDMAECARRYTPAPLPAVRIMDLRQATREGTRALPAHDLVYRYQCARARQPMTQDELEQRQARGIEALEHLRMVWKARELMRADFAARQRALALDIYGPPAREPVVVQIKRRRTA